MRRKMYGTGALGLMWAVAMVACGDDAAPSPAAPPDTASGGLTSSGAPSTPSGSSGTAGPGGSSGTPLPPSTVDDRAATARDVGFEIEVTHNDAVTAGVELEVTPPAHGTAHVVDGRVQYAPESGFVGEDSFRYTVRNGGGESQATVTVTVEDAPGTVAHGVLYTAELHAELQWADINAAGDRVGRRDDKSLWWVRADGREVAVPPPSVLGASDDALVRGVGADGTVLGQHVGESTGYGWVGFAWRDGAGHSRTCDLGAEGPGGDCTLERLAADGTIVGTEFLEWTTYRGFVWAPDGARVPLAPLPGYAHSYGRAIGAGGLVIATVDSSASGYAGPSRCARGVPVIADGVASGLALMEVPPGAPHFVDCRGVNAAGLVVGTVRPTADGEGVPRSQSDRTRAGLWHPQRGFAYLRFPVPRPRAEAWRMEQVFGINDAGVIVGTLQDALPSAGAQQAPQRITRGITLRPQPAQAGVRFADSTFDHVND